MELIKKHYIVPDTTKYQVSMKFNLRNRNGIKVERNLFYFEFREFYVTENNDIYFNAIYSTSPTYNEDNVLLNKELLTVDNLEKLGLFISEMIKNKFLSLIDKINSEIL